MYRKLMILSLYSGLLSTNNLFSCDDKTKADEIAKYKIDLTRNEHMLASGIVAHALTIYQRPCMGEATTSLDSRERVSGYSSHTPSFIAWDMLQGDGALVHRAWLKLSAESIVVWHMGKHETCTNEVCTARLGWLGVKSSTTFTR